MSVVPCSMAYWTFVGKQDGANNFSCSGHQGVSGVDAGIFSVVPAENTHLKNHSVKYVLRKLNETVSKQCSVTSINLGIFLEISDNEKGYLR